MNEIKDAQQFVEVIYDFESKTSKGHGINALAGECYSLAKDVESNDDQWCLVCQLSDQTNRFFLPKSYIRPTTPNLTNFIPNRQSVISEDVSKVVHRRKNPRFKLADPRRISSSIPCGLDLVHNLADLTTEQEQNDHDRSGCVKNETRETMTRAIPRLSFLNPGVTADDSSNDSTNDHHYQNVRQLDRETRPPVPERGQMPMRILNDGWSEFSCNDRSYFFHQQTGISQWKPPRFLLSPTRISAILVGASEEEEEVEEVEKKDDGETVGQASPILQDNSRTSPASFCPPAGLEAPPKNSTFPKLSHSFDWALADSPPNAICVRNQAYRLSMTNDRKPSEIQPHTSVRNGLLDKCKLAEAGHRMRRKEWNTCFVFLTSAHMIFYKDEKSAQKFGRHFPSPLGVCDLRGALLSWMAKEADKRRKHVFQLKLVDGTIYLFSAENSQDINGWFHTVRQVIAKLPQPDQVSENRVSIVKEDSDIGRNLSPMKVPSSSLPRQSEKEKETKKIKRKSAILTESNENVIKKTSSLEMVHNRETIVEKLRRFFRSRPSIESLKEKGIYKPEPVFGSTLTAICLRENSCVPKFLKMVTEEIEAKGLDTDGLYRVSGNLSAIQKIRCQVDQDKYTALFAEDDVHVLTGALKLCFRELQEPLFPANLTKDFLNAIRIPDSKQRLKTFEKLLANMPTVHRRTMHLLLEHLLRVSNHANKNRMQIHNLAIVFGPTLFSNGNDNNHQGSKNLQTSKKSKTRTASSQSQQQLGVQSNSHLAFNMIMQGQIVEYLLKEQHCFAVLAS